MIYDFETAILVARDIVRSNCDPRKQLEYMAAPRFGFLRIGDIISLSDTDLYFVDLICQIVRMEWSGSGWKMLVEFQENRILNRGI